MTASIQELEMASDPYPKYRNPLGTNRKKVKTHLLPNHGQFIRRAGVESEQSLLSATVNDRLIN